MVDIQLTGQIYYVGVNDRNTPLFEGMWSLPHGVTYNSYLIVDEKVALIDTIEISFLNHFLDKIRNILGDRPIDYLIINHMEPDHSGAIEVIKQLYPEIIIVGNKQTSSMVEGFYSKPAHELIVADGDTLSLGRHKLQFILTPMVHWPETMMTYDATEKVLFSGDGFGCYGTLNGAVADSQFNTDFYIDEMIRYYATIVGKYGSPVQKALAKLSHLDIQIICSTHGPVWMERVAEIVALYDRLSRSDTDEGVVIAYASMYGNTEQLAEEIAAELSLAGVRNILIHKINKGDSSLILRDIFKYKGLIIGGTTYCGTIHPDLETFLEKLAVRDLKNHYVGCFGSFSWAGQTAKRLKAWVEDRPALELVEPVVELKQGRLADTAAAVKELAQAMAKKLKA